MGVSIQGGVAVNYVMHGNSVRYTSGHTQVLLRTLKEVEPFLCIYSVYISVIYQIVVHVFSVLKLVHWNDNRKLTFSLAQSVTLANITAGLEGTKLLRGEGVGSRVNGHMDRETAGS